MTKVYEALGSVYTKCCGNCQHWNSGFAGPAPAVATIGRCQQNMVIVPADSFTNRAEKFLTLDLALCSKWQEKEDAE